MDSRPKGPVGRRIVAYAVLMALSLIMVGPFAYLALASITEGSALQALRDGHVNPTLRFYGDVWRTFTEMHLFMNTLVICVSGVALELVLASLAAYPLARLEFRGKGVVSGLLLATMMLPVQAGMIVNFTTIRALGLFDTYAAVVLPSAVSVFGIFLMRQAYLTVPKELDEAARLDGASDVVIWWRVLVPLSLPSLATLGLFSFVGYWNAFVWPLVVLKHQERYPLAVGLEFMAEVFDKSFAKIAAGSVLSMIPVIVLFVLMQRAFIKGITAGAVK
ncbi:MAG: carbohydrate ABC transporter permease [Proteobacteria bacterium]|nr:carbohydrate ABC transporter permease [Pseudomonadota bacterium]